MTSLINVIRNTHDLPTLPAIVMDLLNSIDQEDADINTLAKKVSQDQALTGKTLRLANSSYFGLHVKVTTIQQSITLLGFQKVRNIIATAALTGCFPERRCAGFDHKAFWAHSFTTASVAADLARHVGFKQDHAFTAGLLHDIGTLVFVTRFQERYEDAVAYQLECNCPMIEAEYKVFGIDHAYAGQILASHWNFSEDIKLAIAWHHEPETPGAGFLASIVHIASGMAQQLEAAGEVGAEADNCEPPLVSEAAWNALHLNTETYSRIWAENRKQLEEVRRLVLL